MVKWHINLIVPVRKMSIRERDPSYITSEVKVKVNRLIADDRSTALAAPVTLIPSSCGVYSGVLVIGE